MLQQPYLVSYSRETMLSLRFGRRHECLFNVQSLKRLEQNCGINLAIGSSPVRAASRRERCL